MITGARPPILSGAHAKLHCGIFTPVPQAKRRYIAGRVLEACPPGGAQTPPAPLPPCVCTPLAEGHLATLLVASTLIANLLHYRAEQKFGNTGAIKVQAGLSDRRLVE
ncbi:hypothetical protein NDU88_001175 [Pleurodeles waltl]|uniref:Uncharacterized protein n=1 Tax=Pleurodeles waltl TaxID=8319 RepID=A0AAV7MKS3_PLEWA|nr:hypothetical protein NDU88_001175 [Pleurodeles waltl]